RAAKWKPFLTSERTSQSELSEPARANSRRCKVPPGPKAGHGLFLILKGRNCYGQVQHLERLQHRTSRTHESQVAPLISQRRASRSDHAQAGTVDLAQVSKIQQKLAYAFGNQLL